MQRHNTNIKELRRKFLVYLTIAIGLGIALVWFSVQFDTAIRESWLLIASVCAWAWICVLSFSHADTYRNYYDYACKRIPTVNTMQHGLNKRFVQLLRTVGWILFPLGITLYYTFDIPSIGNLGITFMFLAGYALICLGKVPAVKPNSTMQEPDSKHITTQFNATHEYEI